MKDINNPNDYLTENNKGKEKSPFDNELAKFVWAVGLAVSLTACGWGWSNNNSDQNSSISTQNKAPELTNVDRTITIETGKTTEVDLSTYFTDSDWEISYYFLIDKNWNQTSSMTENNVSYSINWTTLSVNSSDLLWSLTWKENKILIEATDDDNAKTETFFTFRYPEAQNATAFINLEVPTNAKENQDFSVLGTISDADGLTNVEIEIKNEKWEIVYSNSEVYDINKKTWDFKFTTSIWEAGKYTITINWKWISWNEENAEITHSEDLIITAENIPTPTPIDNLTTKKWPSVSNITKTTATISNNISDADWVKDIKYYLDWVEVSSPNLTWLTAGTTYEVYTSASVINGETWDYVNVESEKVSFTTQSETTPTNTAPEATNDTANTAHNTPVTIDVLANDTDAENDTLTIKEIKNKTWWTWEITADNKQIKFTPTDGFSWTATATYEISDGNGGTNTASVSVEVETPAPTWSTITDITEWDDWWKDFTRDFSTFIENANGWTFSASNLPTWLTINENTWVVTWYFNAHSSEVNRDWNSNVFSNIVITYTKNWKTYNSNAFTRDVEDDW